MKKILKLHSVFVDAPRLPAEPRRTAAGVHSHGQQRSHRDQSSDQNSQVKNIAMNVQKLQNHLTFSFVYFQDIPEVCGFDGAAAAQVLGEGGRLLDAPAQGDQKPHLRSPAGWLPQDSHDLRSREGKLHLGNGRTTF